MPDIAELLAELDAESAELDGLVADLSAEQWRMPTPAPGWTIAHQIGHLHWTDQTSITAATDSDAFSALLTNIGLDTVDQGAAEFAALAPEDLLSRWRAGRTSLGDALRNADPAAKLPWFGPPMRATSMVTARIMETWAHGQDVADALGVRREPTTRIRHVAHIAVRARGFAYLVRGETMPDGELYVELSAPDGDTWTWGEPDAAQSVRGSALDFALLATQRRHRDDTDVVAEGADADHWLDIAQAFAGPPGAGRRKGQFA